MSQKEADIRGKVTKELKQQFTDVLESIGLSPSVAIGMFARQVVACQGLPFIPHRVRPFNTETLQALDDVAQNRNLITHDSVDAMFDNWDTDLP
jgi:addiction module RelB/DinJ family antitoxin